MRSGAPGHLPEREHRDQEDDHRHVEVEFATQEGNRLHLPQHGGQGDRLVRALVHLKQREEVVAQTVLQTTQVVGVEAQRVHVRVVEIEVVALHERNAEQEEGAEETEEDVAQRHRRGEGAQHGA